MTYTNDKIDKFNLQDYSLFSIPTEEYLIQCKQLMMSFIFWAKIYNDQLSYNDLCDQYFGEGYITNSTFNDIKADCRALIYPAIHKREKMTLCQIMNIYNHPEEIYHCFTYFYFAEFCTDDIFNNLTYTAVGSAKYNQLIAK